MRRLMLGMLLATGAAVPTLAAAETTTTQERPADAGQQRGGPGGGERARDQGGRPDQPRVDQPRPDQQRAERPRPQPQPQPMAAPPVQAQAQARVDGRGDRGRGGGDAGLRADAAMRGNDGNRFGGGGRFQGEDRGRFGEGDRRRFDEANRQPPQGQFPQGQFPQGQPAPDRGYRGPQGGAPATAYRPQGNPGGYRVDAYGRGAAPQYRQGPGGPGQYAQGQYRPGGGNWNRGWRDDRRYDWGRYRTENRFAFRLSYYQAPRGWNYGYRRFSPGITLYAGLFDQGFWIDDPFAYRLPPAYGPYRWVRYYNDALLVDVRSGYVVDTVYDIFW